MPRPPGPGTVVSKRPRAEVERARTLWKLVGTRWDSLSQTDRDQLVVIKGRLSTCSEGDVVYMQRLAHELGLPLPAEVVAKERGKVVLPEVLRKLPLRPPSRAGVPWRER
jgi:hypothetical protein